MQGTHHRQCGRPSARISSLAARAWGKQRPLESMDYGELSINIKSDMVEVGRTGSIPCRTQQQKRAGEERF